MTVERVAVVGAGTMGAGIAQAAAACGCSVRLIDVSADVLAMGMAGIRKHVRRSVEKVRISQAECDAILARIETADSIRDWPDTQLAVEAVVERMDVKRLVFAQLDAYTPADCVLATNTSSLRVSEIAEGVKDAGRVVGMHFFNPAPIMPLVEVIAADASHDWAIDRAFEVSRAWKKTPVRAKDTPGFIVNRVARGFYLEALRMLGEGVADVATIDHAMRALGGFRMGPFELMDLIGVDVNYAVSQSVYEQSGRPARLTPHEIQRQLVEKGEIGRKAGRGLYDYSGESPSPAVRVAERAMASSSELAGAVDAFVERAALCDEAPRRAAQPVESYVFARILATIMNEAAMTLEDGVASAEDIDTAMRLGTNYPKGPLTWADEVGAVAVGRLLVCLNDADQDGRFAPAKRLVLC